MGPSDGNLVGVVGAGRLGQAMAQTARRAGRDVVIANSRGPQSLASVVSALGAGVSAATVDEAASAGIVVIAVPWDRVPEAVQGSHRPAHAVRSPMPSARTPAVSATTPM
jgi:predicted dinucleotide-binding enzyme